MENVLKEGQFFVKLERERRLLTALISMATFEDYFKRKGWKEEKLYKALVIKPTNKMDNSQNLDTLISYSPKNIKSVLYLQEVEARGLIYYLKNVYEHRELEDSLTALLDCKIALRLFYILLEPCDL